MIQVKVLGKTREYEAGTPLVTLAEEYQQQFAHRILLAKVNGRLKELYKVAEDGSEITFLTAADKPGFQVYERSAIFLTLKAAYDVIGRVIERVTVEFSMGAGIYISVKGVGSVDQALADRVKERMQELVKAELPIRKYSVPVEEAIRRFEAYGMHDKVRLLQFRRDSEVNLYRIDDFEDYYYGYMVSNTADIRYFDLKAYQNGVLLLLPTRENPEKVGEMPQREKLFQTLYRSTEWGAKLHVSNVGALNTCISKGRINDLILMQEGLMEKEIGDIAEMIATQPDKRLIMIAGPSSSGKTTFSHRLSVQLRARGLTPHTIEVDNYFVEREHTPKDADGNYDYECLGAMDVELFNQNMTNLLAGKTVAMPTYNFITGKREYKGDTMTLKEGEILVLEGIHCLNEAFSYALPREKKFKIYISALTQLNIDEHNRIPTTDGRLLRRMVRDARKRGASAQDTIRRWTSVRRGEEMNIFPHQEDADVMFNSALVYELAVLKQYAEPLLFTVPRDSEEYLEAKRLLKFLNYFLGISSEDIPRTSLVREFIGGSVFKA